VITAFLLAAIPIAPQAPKPIETTIAAIRADPKRFDGQVVRLHGWVNACTPRGCLIEEHRENSAGAGGQWLSIAADPKFDATVKPLLPTWIELDARVDATCLRPSTVCADRSPDLTVILLRGVIDPTEPPPED
jgi:hypothetical protein